VKLILKIAAGIILAVVVMVVAIAALAGKAVSDATQKTTWTVQVKAPAGYSWSGAFGSRTVDGTGSKTITVRDMAITSADAQKQDGGNWPLRLILSKDGKVLDNQVTTAEYGLVDVTGSDF
jgi:hypothetical protein